jgi:hypothetical protein
MTDSPRARATVQALGVELFDGASRVEEQIGVPLGSPGDGGKSEEAEEEQGQHGEQGAMPATARSLVGLQEDWRSSFSTWLTNSAG